MRDDEEDPFERLGPTDDREGDPFEHLGPDEGDESRDSDPISEPATANESTDADTGEPAADGDDLLSDVDIDAFRTGENGSVDSDADAEDPFSDVGDRDEDPFGSEESPFERVDVDQIDVDKVWAEMAEDGDSDGDPPESRYAEVSKHRYCEQCEHFSEPPTVRCTNDGTEIVEFVDMETVRLLDCPVVAEQHDIEREQ